MVRNSYSVQEARHRPIYKGCGIILTNVSLSNNNSNQDGGGINNAGAATLTNVTMTGNFASVDGGISTKLAR